MKTKSGVLKWFMFYLMGALTAAPAWAADTRVAPGPSETEAQGQSLGELNK